MDEMSFTRTDIKIVAHAINWVLNVPFNNTEPPQLSEQDQHKLELVFARFTEILAKQSARVSLRKSNEFKLEGDILYCPSGHIALIFRALRAFSQELAQSPTEIEIVTGLPAANLQELCRRMALVPTVPDGMFDSLGAPATR